MVGRAAQGNPWAIGEIANSEAGEPSREEVVAELVLFMRETVRELGERRATGFLKKFYGWYLGRGRFPRPLKQELVRLETVADVEARLFAEAPGARSSSWPGWRTSCPRARTCSSISQSRFTEADKPPEIPAPLRGAVAISGGRAHRPPLRAATRLSLPPHHGSTRAVRAFRRPVARGRTDGRRARRCMGAGRL